jgi:hypothetical protein
MKMINGIGGMTSAQMIAMLAIEGGQEDKKAHDAMRSTEEAVEEQEDKKQLGAMEDKAIWNLVGGIGKGAMQAGGAATGAVGHAQGWSDATQKNVSDGFGAGTSIWDGTTQALTSFADKAATEHKMAADRARTAAEDCKDDSKQARGLIDQGVEAARTIQQTENETLLLSAKRA